MRILVADDEPEMTMVLEALRAKNVATPVLLLTARSQVEDRVAGLDSGAEINVVWAYISYLRRKLEAVGGSVRITACRGQGYVLEEIL